MPPLIAEIAFDHDPVGLEADQAKRAARFKIWANRAKERVAEQPDKPRRGLAQPEFECSRIERLDPDRTGVAQLAARVSLRVLEEEQMNRLGRRIWGL